jgi:hypothetical protein
VARTFRHGTHRHRDCKPDSKDKSRSAFFDSKVDGLFVDGGVTPHNNPSLTLFLMSVLKPYRICWETGPENLTIVSIGTGTHRPRLEFDKLGFGRFPKLGLHALMSLMTDAETMVLMQMQWMGECLTPWQINSEIGTVADSEPKGGKMFKFIRYDVKLEQDWLRNELKMKVSEDDLVRLRCMDDPGTIREIYEIGQRAAELQVDKSHWEGMLPDWCAGPRAAPPARGAPPDTSGWAAPHTSSAAAASATRSGHALTTLPLGRVSGLATRSWRGAGHCSGRALAIDRHPLGIPSSPPCRAHDKACVRGMVSSSIFCGSKSRRLEQHAQRHCRACA